VARRRPCWLQAIMSPGCVVLYIPRDCDEKDRYQTRAATRVMAADLVDQNASVHSSHAGGRHTRYVCCSAARQRARRTSTCGGPGGVYRAAGLAFLSRT